VAAIPERVEAPESAVDDGLDHVLQTLCCVRGQQISFYEPLPYSFEVPDNEMVPALDLLAGVRIRRNLTSPVGCDRFDDFHTVTLVRHEMVREFRMHFPAAFALEPAQIQCDFISIRIEIPSKTPVIRL
jgi:hypothetical protein